MRNVIHWELCKFKFNPTNKQYMHKTESLLKIETQKIPWDFYIQADYLIPARRQDLVIVFKKKTSILDFAVVMDHRLKIKETEKRHQYLDLVREQKTYGRWRWYKW